MAEASWKTSTLSQAFFLSLIFYMGILVIVTIGVCFFNPNIENVKLIVGWASALEAAVSSAYLTARKVNGNTNGNGHAPEEVKT